MKVRRWSAGLLLALATCPEISFGAASKRAPAAARNTPKKVSPASSAKIPASMTVRDRIAQMIVIPIYGRPETNRVREYRRIFRAVRDLHVGGLILVNQQTARGVRRVDPYSTASLLNRLQRMAGTPLIVASDLERGPSMRIEGTAAFPHAMAFGAAGAPEETREMGAVTAREARALGIHWILFPVADVNNNPDNPVINIRSFGEDPNEVARHVTAFLEGARSVAGSPVLTAVKHFPGHGDTSTDTHLNLSAIPGDKDRLEKLELVPFRAAIEAKVDAVLSAHLTVPALDDSGVPATLSKPVLTDLLQGELNFRGLVVTDALDMGGIVKGFGSGEAAVRAVQAGADVLLMPQDPDAAIQGLTAAVKDGRISTKRIDESVQKILAAKQRLGLFRKRLVDVEAIEDVIDSSEAADHAAAVARRAVTLVRDEGRLLPLRAEARPCVFVLSENRYSPQGTLLVQELKAKLDAGAIQLLDSSMSETALNEAVAAKSDCGVTVIAAFTSVALYRSGTSLPGNFTPMVTAILTKGKPVVLASLGNPYLIRSFPSATTYVTTFSSTPPSESALGKALLGDARIEGRMPVTIPGIAKLGDGIRR